MDQKTLKKISKHLSRILRHQADLLRLNVDPEGFVAIDDLLPLMRQAVPDISSDVIHQVVEMSEPHKQRFSIMDGTIRANYGHSFSIRIEYLPQEPPATLYHGTSMDAKPAILRDGLLPMKRQFVHLTTDIALARQIGTRHGVPFILAVDAARAHRDGIAFYSANKTFWLIAFLPSQYLNEYDN